MSIKKLITGLMLSLLLVCGMASAADYDKGLKAYNSGDFEVAIAELTPLSEQGHVRATELLNVVIFNTLLLEQKSEKAKYGDAGSQYWLGHKYSAGEGVPENDKTAVKWYTLAAEQGHAQAQFNLGLMAEHGDAEAQFNLGGMYDIGQGVPQNAKAAVKWYTLAAEQGHADMVKLFSTTQLRGFL